MSLWQAEYARSPWGEVRGDLAAGVIAATLANAHRGKDAAPFTPADFMPLVVPRQAEPAPDPVAFFQDLAR